MRTWFEKMFDVYSLEFVVITLLAPTSIRMKLMLTHLMELWPHKHN